MSEPTGNYQPQPYPNQPQPPAYGGQPAPAYGGGAYESYAQAYGQGLPAHMDAPEKPQALKTAMMIQYIMLGVSLLAAVLNAIFAKELLAMQNGVTEMLLGSSSMPGADAQEAQAELLNASGAMAVIMAFAIGFSLVWLAIQLLFIIFMGKGRNWARIVLTIFAGFSILSLLDVIGYFVAFHWVMLFGPINAILAIVFLVFAWKRPVSEYMRNTVAYRQWQLQRSYMGR